MVSIADLTPQCDKKPKGWGAEQLFITGMKGTGKSTLERRIIDELPDDEVVVVVDSKHDWDYEHKRLPGLLAFAGVAAREHRRVWTKLPTCDLRLVPPGRYVYRPSYPEIADAGAHKIFETAMKAAKPKKRSVTVVLDEAGDFSSGGANGQPIRPLGKLVRESRSMWVRLIIGTQRPAGIPLIFIQEASKTIAFYLENDNDRKRLADWKNRSFFDNPPEWHDFNFNDARKRAFKTIHQQGGAAA